MILSIFLRWNESDFPSQLLAVENTVVEDCEGNLEQISAIFQLYNTVEIQWVDYCANFGVVTPPNSSESCPQVWDQNRKFNPYLCNKSSQPGKEKLPANVTSLFRNEPWD